MPLFMPLQYCDDADRQISLPKDFFAVRLSSEWAGKSRYSLLEARLAQEAARLFFVLWNAAPLPI